jgi:hypothetical protein
MAAITSACSLSGLKLLSESGCIAEGPIGSADFTVLISIHQPDNFIFWDSLRFFWHYVKEKQIAGEAAPLDKAPAFANQSHL